MFRGAAGTEPLVSGPEALKTELIRLAIYESSNQGRTLTLDYDDIDLAKGADGVVVKTWGEGAGGQVADLVAANQKLVVVGLGRIVAL